MFCVHKQLHSEVPALLPRTASIGERKRERRRDHRGEEKEGSSPNACLESSTNTGGIPHRLFFPSALDSATSAASLATFAGSLAWYSCTHSPTKEMRCR